MNKLTTKASLSASQRQLVELMQRYSFCRIEGLEIRSGEPIFRPPPRVVQDIKIGAENGSRPELDKEDFLLKAAVVELFQHFSRLGDVRVAVVEVRGGLPFRLIIEQPLPEGVL